MTDIEQLKAAALAATDCPWVSWTIDSGSINPNQAFFLAGPQQRAMDHTTGLCKADAAFIAAANPAAILAMIERLQVAEDAAKKGADRLLFLYDSETAPIAGPCPDYDDWLSSIDNEIAARRLT